MNRHTMKRKAETKLSTIRVEATRIAKAVQSCDEILSSQDIEITALTKLVNNATIERAQVAKHATDTLQRKTNISRKLVMIENEIIKQKDKLLQQTNALKDGAREIAIACATRDIQANKISAIHTAIDITNTVNAEADNLRKQIINTEKNLDSVRIKITTLQSELQYPKNIHPWRKLSSDSWATLRRCQMLTRDSIHYQDQLQKTKVRIIDIEQEKQKLLTKIENIQSKKEVVDPYKTLTSINVNAKIHDQEILNTRTATLTKIEASIPQSKIKLNNLREKIKVLRTAMLKLDDEYVLYRIEQENIGKEILDLSIKNQTDENINSNQQFHQQVATIMTQYKTLSNNINTQQISMI